MGITLNTKFSLKIFAYSFYSFKIKSKMPLSTNDAGVSPGCTREVRNIVYLSNINGL